ncbi:hypothetical protein [Nonomuraea sp. NPDC049141]|uniref:hypothetical protein n=1 Tax=Nonomuraea sp. NPDC049141 TaxID=3155500 RepID=UPI0033E85F64
MTNRSPRRRPYGGGQRGGSRNPSWPSTDSTDTADTGWFGTNSTEEPPACDSSTDSSPTSDCSSGA